MKHFLIEITYRVPFEQLAEIRPTHLKYMQAGYQDGTLLFSGPQEPRIGGIVLARAASLAEMQDFIDHDPYRLNQVADYRVVEFQPILSQPFMTDWIGPQDH